MKKQNFLVLGDLVRTNNKVYIERNSLFLDFYFSSPTADIHDRMVERECNVAKINNNEILFK